MGLKEIVKTPGERLEPAIFDPIYLRNGLPTNRTIDLFRADPRIEGFDALPTPIMVLCNHFYIIYANAAWLRMVGHRRRNAVGRNLFDLFPETPERMETVRKSLQTVLAGQTTELKSIPYRLETGLSLVEDDQAASVRYWSIQNSPLQMKGHKGPLILQTAREVSDSVAMDKQASLLREELQHRLRNTISLALGVLRTRARKHTKIDELVKDMTDRLRAIAAQQDALMPMNSFSNGLQDILLREIMPFTSQNKVSFDGPCVILSEDVAVSVSLLIHELVSNAGKHGSFSKRNGRLTCSWSIGDSGLFFEWKESGVRCSGIPHRKGFGSALLERLPNIEVTRTFTEDGLHVSAFIRLQSPDS